MSGIRKKALSSPGLESRPRPLVRRLEHAGNAYRVLLAHPDPQIGELMATLLRGDDFRVFRVKDGIGVLEWLADSILGYPERDSPDLIVVDLELPGRKGIDLLADLRYANLSVPFILISDRRHQDAAELTRRLRWTAVFDAPFDADDFRTSAFVLTRCYRRNARHGRKLVDFRTSTTPSAV